MAMARQTSCKAEILGLIIVSICYALVIACDVIAGTAYLAQIRETEKRL